MAYVVLKYLHIIAAMTLFATLVIEHMFLKREMSPRELARIATVDMIYGLSAGVVLIAGLLLWFVVGKPPAFYSLNPVFHSKVALFVLVGLLSIYPTVFFIKNRRATTPVVELPKSIIMIVRFELLLLLLIPLLAVIMAQGYGLS